MIHRPVVGERCPGPPDEPVVHTHGSVALLLRGPVVLHMGSAWTVQEGDVFLVPEGAPHYRVDREHGDYVGIGVCMSCIPTTGWGPTLRALFVAVGEGACPVLRPGDADRDELVRTLRSLQDEPDVGAPWLVDARLGVLTALLRRAVPAAAPRPHDSPVVARALDHIARHALEPLSLVDVARAVGRAPSHLATRVKAETGESVGAWIAHARMAQARELLLRGDDTVDVVAEKVGYRSPSHFHRTFRGLHGLSPAAWRDEHRRRTFADAEGLASALDDPTRDAWQRPEDVLRAMELAPTMRVADVGAGTGYFAVRLARAVPAGEVTATDIEPSMVQFANERAHREGLPNLRAILARPPGSGLAREHFDRILVAHVWHHLHDRGTFARDLSAALRPGGRLFVVDYALGARRGPPPSLRVAPGSIVAELEAAGLTARISAVAVPDQYIIEARRATS